MSRLLAAQPNPNEIKALLQSEAFETALCVEFQFKSETVRFSNRVTSFTDNNGIKWKGLKGLVSVSELSGGTDNLGSYIEYGLGIPWEMWDLIGEVEKATIPALVSNPEEYAGRDAILSLQIFNDGSATGLPISLDTGVMNKPRLSVKPSAISLRINSENVFSRKRIPPFGYLTNGNQQHLYPTDNGLRYVPTTASKPVDWLNSN